MQHAYVRKFQDDAFAGQSFTRLAIAKAVAHMSQSTPSAIAAARWGKTDPTLVEWIKANEVAAGGAASGAWGAELVAADTRYTGDFIEYLYSQTVYDRLPLRSVPADIQIKGQDGAATGYFVGEGKAIPVSKADFMAVNLSPLKAAGLAVISKDLLRRSTPEAESLVRDALVDAVGQVIDTRFVSATAASAGVSPAGILNGVSALGSSGNDLDGLIADIQELFGYFITQKNFGGLAWVMNPTLALRIGQMRNDFGQKVFPTITPQGGTLEGFPVVTGDNVGSDDLILLKPSDIYRIDDRGIEVSVSTDATIEMASDPTGDEGVAGTPVAVSKQPVSLFQNEAVALKVVRSFNYSKRRSTAVTFMTDARYGTGTPTD
jgi:HK97 family phage major capsid protein